jgi:hypothetical protein
VISGQQLIIFARLASDCDASGCDTESRALSKILGMNRFKFWCIVQLVRGKRGRSFFANGGPKKATGGVTPVATNYQKSIGAFYL